MKLGIVKNVIKAIDKNEGFLSLKRKFLNPCEAKIKEEAFQGPQIRQLMFDCDFEKSLTDLKRQTWLSVKAVMTDERNAHQCRACKKKKFLVSSSSL